MTKQLLSNRSRLCIVIPMCNEERSLAVLGTHLQALSRTLDSSYRIHYLFVDDGSTDRTAEQVPGIVPGNSSHEVCVHTHNRGIGAAFRTAFQRVKADVVCTVDADCSYGLKHLPKMIEEVQSGRSDIVVASPYHPEGKVEGVQAWRRMLSMQCSHLYRRVCPLELYTYTSIFRAYRGSIVPRLAFKSDGFVAVVEMLFSAADLGLRVSELPLTLHRRATGFSKMRVLRTILDHSLLIARYAAKKVTRVLLHRSTSGAISFPLSILGKVTKEAQGMRNR